MRRVVFLVFDGFQVLDLTGPHEVFAHAGERYERCVVAAEAGPVRSDGGVTVYAPYGLGDVDPSGVDTLVVAGGPGVDAARDDGALPAWIAGTAAAGARRVTSVCSGALLLAAAGLLDGRRATTHWSRAGQLAREYPDVVVDPDPIFVRDGPVWTSAGVTAGIDLALALVEEDHGGDLAHAVARALVMFLRRPGGQSQFSVPLWSRPPESDPIRTAVDAVHADPGARHTVATLAARATCSAASPPSSACRPPDTSSWCGSRRRGAR
jgi:transcriptional regulator GlxA family with amidase domain